MDTWIFRNMSIYFIFMIPRIYFAVSSILFEIEDIFCRCINIRSEIC